MIRLQRKKMIIGILCIVMLVAALLVGILTKKEVTEVKPGIPCTYCISGTVYNFNDSLTMKPDEETGELILSDGEFEMEAGVTPVYSAPRDVLFTTSDMAYYKRNGNGILIGKKITACTEFDIIESTIVIKRNDKSEIEGDGFLYDGYGAYIFMEDMTVSIGEETYKIPALSFLRIDRNNWIEIYNRVSGKYLFIQIDGQGNYASDTKGLYRISLDSGVVSCDEQEIMLQTSADVFSNYFE